MRHQFWARAGASAAAIALIGFTACSSDEGGDNTGGNDGTGINFKLPERTEGSIFDDLDVDDPERTETRFNEVPKPYTDEAGCKAFDARFPSVHDCSCEKCFDLQQQCDSLKGCVEISECGIEIGCSDANSCYLLAPPGKQQCVPIIDRWGNTGTSSALSLALSSCLTTNKCRDSLTP